MTEPREPFPRDNGEFDIDLKKAVLTEALRAFNEKVLSDDMLFRAISTTLQGTETTTDKPDFSVTPNLRKGKFSLCLEESAKGDAGKVETDNGAVGSMFFKFTTMKYIHVGEIESDETGRREIAVDKPFVELALGREVATEKPTHDEIVALEAAVRTVLDGINEIGDYCSRQGVEVVSDDFGRPQLLEEAQISEYATD